MVRCEPLKSVLRNAAWSWLFLLTALVLTANHMEENPRALRKCPGPCCTWRRRTQHRLSACFCRYLCSQGTVSTFMVATVSSSAAISGGLRLEAFSGGDSLFSASAVNSCNIPTFAS